jgi:hypothetical protein
VPPAPCHHLVAVASAQSLVPLLLQVLFFGPSTDPMKISIAVYFHFAFNGALQALNPHFGNVAHYVAWFMVTPAPTQLSLHAACRKHICGVVARAVPVVLQPLRTATGQAPYATTYTCWCELSSDPDPEVSHDT